ncbi:tail fiber assembly protein, partial [uncultured Desulfovibrio sp.]
VFIPPPPPTEDELFTQLRVARDAKLTATDKYLLPDYPISADALSAVKAYRQTLRDLPGQEGAPWDGGGELTPWPELPAVQGV